MTPQRVAQLVAVALAVGVLALILLGRSGEARVDAETLLEAVNEAGADLVLGDRLPDVDYPCPSEEDADRTCSGELWQISFEAGAGVIEDGGGHGSGTLLVVEDADRAHDEWRRCEQAITLVCYRAANAVLRFTEITFAERERTREAISALASE